MTQLTQNDDDTSAHRDAPRFVSLGSESALGELVRRSELEPVVVFQHDPYCPISRRAYHEMVDVPVQTALIDVAQDQDLSRAIEERTGVRHESPQVLVFRSGKVVWNASHFKITRKAVMRAVLSASTHSLAEGNSDCGIACGSRAAPKVAASDTASVLNRIRSLWDQQ